MTRIVQALDESCFVAHLAKPDDGVSAITQVATVNLPNLGNTECYVKTYPTHKEVFNEIAGYLLAKSLSLPTPEVGAVIVVPWAIFQYAPQFETWQSRLSWLTSSVPGVNPKTQWHFPGGNIIPKEFLDDLKLWDCKLHTVAKDDWTGNVDRNVGNLLRIGKGRYVLIDHGAILTSKNWLAGNLDPRPANNVNILHFILWGRTPPPKVEANAIVDCSRQHGLAFRRVSEELHWWASQLLSEMDHSFALNYIEQRAKEAELRLSTFYGVLDL